MFGHSNTSFAETCFIAEGDVITQNINDTQQIGEITLNLLNPSYNPVFTKTGSLVGTVTGGGFDVSLLSHVATFSNSQRFITQDDEARITGVRALDSEGLPCSFYINEKITKIITGTGFFNNVKSVDIDAVGYISYCPGENINEFTISGQICK